MDATTINNRTAAEADKKIWQRHCKSLAEVALQRFAIKRDRHGMYSADGSAAWSFSELTKDDLAAHFAGDITMGLGTTSQDDKCLWVAVDLDNHVDDQATNQNLDYAIILLNKLAEHGVYAIVEDSDGKGGIHLWVLFDQPVPAESAFRFINWITQGHEQHVEKIECFPKQPTVQNTAAKCGNYLRLPGKHPKREHWSSCWGENDWLNAEQSIELLLDPPLNDPACLAQAPKPPPTPVRKEYDGPQTNTVELARTALPYISNDGYDQWLKIGQALHSEGDHMLSEWQHWSASSEKFKPGECEAKWKTFNRNGSVGIGTVFHLATENGWQRPKEHRADKPVDFSGIEGQAEPKSEPKKWQLQSGWSAVAKPAPMRSIVIEGLARRGEVVNIVAATKIGKSWLALLLLLCVSTGRLWLGRKTTKGRVLLLDNELHSETIQNRIHAVATAAGIIQRPDDAAFDYVELRGESVGIGDIEYQLSAFQPGDLTLIVMDAKYRFFGNGMEENSNDDQTSFHNAVDRLAKQLNCVIVLVHHSTKGDQSGKSVVDVGSGGGSQARAADCHLILRTHEDGDDLCVLDAALRTFKKVEPQTLRWEFPLWTVDESVEPTVKQAQTRSDATNDKRVKTKITSILQMLRLAPGNIHSENKLSGNHAGSLTYRSAIAQLQEAGEIEWVDDFKEPRAKENTGGWRLVAGRSEV